MGQSPSEANCRSTNQELPPSLRYPKIFYSIHNALQRVPVLNQWISSHPYILFLPSTTEILLCQRITSSLFHPVYWIKFVCISYPSHDSVVGIATGYGLDDRGVRVRVPVRSRIFSSPRCQDRLWGPPNLLSNGYMGLFPREYSSRGVKLTTHLQLVPRSRKCGSIHPFSHTPSWRSA
jgi:hypothetical protein